jgi:hypothetical protein
MRLDLRPHQSPPAVTLEAGIAAAVLAATGNGGIMIARRSGLWTASAMLAAAIAAASLTRTSFATTPQSDSGIAAPALNNPQNPVSYGADPAGAADSAAAFQRAVEAGDLDVPPGLFRIDGSVHVPGSRNIRCEPGSALEYTTTGNLAMFNWSGTSNGSVFNCRFRGVNYNVNGKAAASSAFQQFIFAQSLGGEGGSNLTIANNDFNGIGGFIAAIHIYASDRNQPGPHNILITHNTFEHCGLYAVQLTSGHDNIISYNTLVDCNGFVEADDLGQMNTGNIIDHNTLLFIHGVGQWGPGLGGYNEMSCGAWPQGFDYSGNTCSNNVVTGFSGTPAHIIQRVPGGVPARYINNTCSDGCTVM